MSSTRTFGNVTVGMQTTGDGNFVIWTTEHGVQAIKIPKEAAPWIAGLLDPQVLHLERLLDIIICNSQNERIATFLAELALYMDSSPISGATNCSSTGRR